MSDTPISLASLMTPSKTVTIDFPGYSDMTVDLCYLAREELVKLRKKCVTTKFSKKTRQPAFDPDDYLGFTQENAELLMKNSSDFDTWVTETVGDLENFTGNK